MQFLLPFEFASPARQNALVLCIKRYEPFGSPGGLIVRGKRRSSQNLHSRTKHHSNHNRHAIHMRRPNHSHRLNNERAP